MSESFDFDEEQCQTFMSHLAEDYNVPMQRAIASGYSGARTFLVHLEPHHSSNASVKSGKYILKISYSDEATQEIKSHKTAKESSILGLYVPDLIESPISYNDSAMPLIGILYQIAGESLLTRTTLQKSLKQRHVPKQREFEIKQIEQLARVIIKWNFEAARIPGTSDLLECILHGIGEDHLKELEERLKRIGRHFDRPRIDLSELDLTMSWRYNPIYFLRSQEAFIPLRQLSQIIPRGLLHGDLHPGNVIISKEGRPRDSFHIIDFASSRIGNVFFDLAYLEIAILLNSRSGFQRLLDLENWWDLEQYLVSSHLPSERSFHGASSEGLRYILPIRRALDARIQQDGIVFKDDYWVAFLAASVEAGLDLARKVHRDASLQYVAFLTAISRFHHLVSSLEASKIPLRGPMTTIHWPGEEVSQKKKESKAVTPTPTISPFVQERRRKIELVWPSEVTQRAALFDPWEIVNEIWSILSGRHDQGVLLIGERIFGKTSFFNSVTGRFQRNRGTLRVVRLDTWGIHTLRSFGTEVLEKMCQIAGLQNSPLPYDGRRKFFNSGRFLQEYQLVADEKPHMRFVICIDEIDGMLNNASSIKEGGTILHLLYNLLTSPTLPIRLFLTATNKEVLKRYPIGERFLRSLNLRKIPLCVEAEMRELIECFDVPLIFEEDTLNSIFQYSGGQIYFIKLAVKLALSVGKVPTDGRAIKRRISKQLLADIMHALESTPATPFIIRDIHEGVFDTMREIYQPKFFSEEEQRFMLLLTEGGGFLRASDFEVKDEKLIDVANTLYERGYISRKRIVEDEEYFWRIGFWQLFLEKYYQLGFRKNQKRL
ncbi:MAG TPA: aminoglycoside phosphotransferase family protein [Methylomirabilota bacterium]|nr:aminoglycoside phosphotransferase family protein [Methylomirabilota bacterium]